MQTVTLRRASLGIPSGDPSERQDIRRYSETAAVQKVGDDEDEHLM